MDFEHRMSRLETKVDNHDSIINKMYGDIRFVENAIENGLVRKIFNEVAEYRKRLDSLFTTILNNAKTISEIVEHKTISKADESHKTITTWNNLIYRIFFFSVLGGGGVALGITVIKCLFEIFLKNAVE